MGYTHYWIFNGPELKNLKPSPERTYQRALLDIQTVLSFVQETEPSILTVSSLGGGGLGLVSLYSKLRFNGPRGFEGEDFTMGARLRQNGEQGFCRTSRMPYDKVVVASLILLAYRLGKGVMVGSDGVPKDWEEGLRLAKRATGIKGLQIPEHVFSSKRLSSDKPV